jgi:sterol desaturase/sphingolipid hydroxylase (fatty acid hydroxylase superfamily)
MSLEAARARRRSEIVERIPSGYRPLLHLASPTVVCTALIAVALSRLRAPTAAELLTVPLALFFAFGVEWWLHKSVLHRRRPGMSGLHGRHELVHHAIFTHDDMAMRSRRELRLVLMPAPAVIGVALFNAPITLALGALAGSNVAWLYLATAMFFFLSYEWIHLSYHLPDDHPVGRLSVVRRLRELHRRHHDPRLMKRWNFNITIPVFDVIRGTLWSPRRDARWGKPPGRRETAHA